MSPHKRPKIGLLFTGGGIAARRDKKTSDFIEICDFNEWMLQVPEINLIAEITPINVFNLGGYQIGSSHWLELAKVVYNNLDSCDGFVITHGLDTILYTASALSFLLKDLGKPVIFTGSRFPPDQEEANSLIASHKDTYKNTLGGIEAKSNLINAVQAATMDIGEVCLLFGSKLLRANRASAVNLFGRDVFGSGEVDPLGEVNFGLELKDHRIRRNPNKKTKLIKTLENKIYFTKITPQVDPNLLRSLIREKYKGLVIEPYFMGEFPPKMVDVLKEMTEEGIILVAASSCFKGSIDFTLYAGGQIGEDLDMISARNMTPSTALTKLMIIMGKESNKVRIKKLMQESWAGEIG